MSSRSDRPASDGPALTVAATPPGEAPTPPVSAEHAELQRQGAKAAARGEASASNPMLESINQPAATGESEQVWSDRRDAWERGRGAQQSAAAWPNRPADGALSTGRALDEALFGVTRLMTFAGEQCLSAAGGFLFERDGRLFLVTSGRVLLDVPSQHAPDRVEIAWHADARDLTRVATLSVSLHRDGLPVWRQTHDRGGEIDVAVLALDRSAIPAGGAVQAFGPQHLALESDVFRIGDRLAIPAFPPGFYDTVHQLPVVRQASIASCYGLRFQGLACFLTDARMQRAGGGLPVLARIEPDASGRPPWCLLGVHSGRLDSVPRDIVQDEPMDLNCAWYADVLLRLTAEAAPAGGGEVRGERGIDST